MRIPPWVAGVAVLTGVALAAPPTVAAAAGRDPPAAPAVRFVRGTPTRPPAEPPPIITPAGRPAWRAVALAGAAVAGLVAVGALVATFRERRDRPGHQPGRERT